jgi:5,10-methylenetetrahydrofolate reductase
MSTHTTTIEAARSFAAGFSIETTPSSASKVADFRAILRPGTKVYIACLPGMNYADVLGTATRLRTEGFCPVPHIVARNISGRAALDELLGRMVREAGVDEVLCIAGGATSPEGDFTNSMEIMRTGLFEHHGIRRINIAGHPEGSPDFPQSAAMDALAWKEEYATRTGTTLELVTQFCFESAPIIEWNRRIRAAGCSLPLRIGIPGVASLKTLITYAKSCGVGPSMNFLLKQARNISKLMTMSTPDKLMAELASYRASDPASGIVGCHLFPFGGMTKTAEWIYALTEGGSERVARAAAA